MSQIDDFLDGGGASGGSIDSFLDSAPAKPNEGGLVASAKQAIGQGIKGAGQVAADYIPGVSPKNSLSAYGQSVVDANPTAVHGFDDIADKPWTAVKESVGNAAGSMGTMVGARALGMGMTAAAPFTGPAAPFVAGAGQIIANAGPIVAAALPSYSGIREGQIQADPNNEADAKSKAIALLGAGTVGAIETKFGPQEWALAAMRKGGIESLGKKFAGQSLVKAAGIGALKGGAIEGGEELVQNPIEQMAAYQDPTTKANVSDTLFGGAMGAIGGGVLGGTMGAVAPRVAAPAPETTPAIADPSTGGTFTPDPNGGVLERGLSAMANAQAEVDVLAPRAIDTVDRGLELVAPSAAPGVIPEIDLPIVGQPEPEPVEPQSIVSGNETGNRTGSAYGDALAKQQRGELLTASDVTALKYPPSDVEIPTEPSTTKKNQSIEPVTRRVDMALPPAVTQQQLDDQEANRSMPRASEQLFTEDAPVFTDQPTQGASNGQEETPQEVLAPQAPAAGASSTTQGTTNGTTPTETQQAETQGQAKQPAAPVARPAALPNHPAAKVVAKALPEAQDVQIHSTDSLSSETTSGSSGRMSKWRGKTIERMAKVFGRKKVVFFSSANTTADGMNIGGGDTLYVNIDAGVDPIAVVGHEWRHALKTSNAAAHAAINQAATKLLEQPGRLLEFAKAYHGTELQQDVVKERIARIEAGEATDEDKAFLAEEFSADMTGNLWRDPKALKEVFDTIMEQHPPSAARTIIKSIGDAILKLIDKLIISTPKGQYSEMGISRDELLGLKKEIQGAMADSFKQDVQRRLDKVRAGQGGEVKFATARKAAEDRKDRTLDEVRDRVAEQHALTVSKEPMLTVDGKPFTSLDMAKAGRGLLVRYPEISMRKMMDDALQESGVPSNIAAKVKVPSVKDVNRALELADGARFWYETSADGFVNRFFGLSKKLTEHVIDIVAGTSGGQKPTDNLKIAVAATAQDLQNRPVTVGTRDESSLTGALSPNTLGTHKFGNFSDTMQSLGGLRPGVKPLPTIDLQMAKVFGIEHAAIASDPRMYEAMSRFLIKLRDAQNAELEPGEQPYESWQLQALLWVAQRDTVDPDSYDVGMPRVVAQLKEAGIPVPGGKITLATLMDPRTPDVLAPTSKLIPETHTATIETRTMLTKTGKSSAEVFEKVKDIKAPWARDAVEEFEAIQRRTMRELGNRQKPKEGNKTRQPSVIAQLMSVILGKSTGSHDVSRVDTNAMGTFEGHASPNMRVPLTLSQTGGSDGKGGMPRYTLNAEQRAQFLAVLGKPLKQAAQAASQFTSTTPGAHDTFSIFVKRYDKAPITEEMLKQIGDGIGRPLNYRQVPNGWLIDINIGGFDAPDQQLQNRDINRVQSVLSSITSEGAEGYHVLYRSYDSDYLEPADYRKHIRKLENEISRNTDTGRSGSAGSSEKRASDYARIVAQVEDIAKQQESAFKQWESDTRELAAKRGIKLSPARSDAAGSPVARSGPGQADVGALPGSVSGTGVHYSKQQRSTLDSSFFGTGLKGDELPRVTEATDPRLKHRIYFYLNTGKGIKPEAGVGIHAHQADLSNIYDATNDTRDLVAKYAGKKNEFESALLDSGYDGYMTQSSGVAILLGERSQPVEYLGTNDRHEVAQAGTAEKSDFGKLQRSVVDNKALPSGEMTGADWKRMMPKLMPEIDVSHLADDQRYYKDGLVKRPAAEVKRSQPRLNSQGEPIHSTETGLRNFWKWFGNGKLVDEQGRPLVLYRGDSHYETPTSFPIAKTRERGIFLTDDETIAKEYTGRSGNSPQALYVRGDKVLDLREDTPKNRKWVKAWAKSFDDWTDRVSGEPVDAWDEIEGGRLFDYEGDWSSERWRDLQAAAGEDYDVLIAPDSLGGETRPSFIALRGESQIKSATGNNGQFDPTNPDIRFSPPRFFSQLATSIDQIPKKMETMPAAQWRMWLNGNAPKLGIKKDEIVWSGIDDYLALRGKDKVTKAEVQQFLSENGTQVNDVVLGGEDVGKYSVDQDPEDGVWRVANSETDEIVDAFDTENEALEAMRGYNVEQGNTKFGQYVVQGGENYRELLITLPEKTEEMKYPEPLVELPKEYVVIEDSSQPEDRRFGVIRDDQANARPAFGRWPTETAAVEEALRMLNYKQNTEYSDGWRARNETGKFKSSHFDQPNIIAHLRMDERTDAQGDKVLFLEEIQSDWGQKGKKEGFAGVTNVQPVAVKKSTGNQETVAEFDSAEAAQAYIAEHPDERLVTWKLPPGGKRGVPAAPFVTDTKSWVALGLKRAIMYAVQNGMSKVAWASGEQNAAHYDLSKQVDEISFLHNPDGTYKIAASNSGSSVLNENNVSIDRIEALVGKDIAKKVEENDGAPIGSSRNFDEATKPQGVRELAKDVFGGEMESLMSLDHVDGGVLPSLKHDQVVNAVIKAIPVDVVNIFSAANISPKDLFSNKDVVTLRLPVDSRSRAADGILSALRLTHATIRTKLSGVLSGGPNVELLPALFASDLNAREVASVVSPSTIFHGGASLSFPNGSASARSGAEPSGINNSIKLDPTTLADFLNRHDALIQKENKRILPQKYISPTSYAIRGSGLRVEAAGMKAFYDEIVPSVANDVLKKLGGGKVETFKINTKGADSDFPDFAKAGVMGAVRTDQMGFTIPPSMAEKVQTEGVPLFSTPRAIPSKDLAIVPVSSFSYNQDSDNYYYHVTSSPNADKALKSGLHPNKKAMFGAYQNYSKGKIFLTERDGVMFWIARVEDQLFDRYDDPPEVAVLRVLKSKLSSVEPDDVGTQDAKHPAVKYSTTRYEVKRDEEDEGTFAVALSNDQKNRNGDPLQVAHLHVPDEAVSAAGWRIGDIQVTKALRRQGIASELVRRMSEHLGSQPIGAASVFSEDGKKFFEGRTRYSTARAQTETPEFKKWFGDSKVVDADGKPLVVYHGTRTDFNEFKEGEGISTDGGYLGAGFYFTPSTDLAGQYGRSESGANVMPVYLSLKNPLIFNGSKEIELLTELGGGPRPLDMLKEAAATSVWAKKVRAGLESLGYDGIMDSSIAEYATEIVVFKPTQIKSAIGNNGQFDAKNPDIRRSTARGAITNQPINQSWQDPDSLGKWDDFVRTMQDKLVDTKRVITAIRAAGVAIKDTIDPYLQEVLYHGRAAKRVSDFADTELRPMLVEMGVRKIERQELEDYLWARHATERNTQIAKINPKMPDGGSGLTNQQAADILSGQTVNIGGRDIKLNLRQMPGYRSLAAKIDAITKETTDTLVRYGLETQDTVDAWRTTYGKYVPLMRDMEADDNYSGAFNLGLGTGQGFSVRGSASKRALGSERGVIDILANVAMQRERAIVRGEKNRVAQSMYGLAITAPNPAFWLALNPNIIDINELYRKRNAANARGDTQGVALLDRQIAAAKGQVAAVEKELITLGLNPIDAANIASEPKQRYTDPKTGMVSERVNPQLLSRGDVLAVRINGKDRYVMFSSNERAQKMVAGLKNLDVDQLGMVMQKMAVVTRWFAAINTQYNPVFGLTNGIRDLGTGMLNLTSTELKGHQAEVFKNAFSALRGVYADLRDHRAGRTPTSRWALEFEEFALEGGQTGYRDMFQTSRDRTEGLMQELKDATKGKTLLTFSEKRSPLFGWLSDYNTSIENAIRLSAYKAAKDKGMTKAQAASLAKNLTVNFNKKGLAATQLGAMYAFFNAAAQGTARIGHTLVKVDNGKFSLTGAGKKIVYGGMMAGVLQAAMFAAAGYDDEEPPQFIREKNFIIPLPDGKYLSVPYPLGFHVIPNIGRVASEFVLGGFKNPGKRLVDMFSMIMDGFNPIGGSSGGVSQMLSPTVTDPLVALSENKDWTGKSIYKEDFNSMHPTAGWTRKKDTASDLSRWMAYGINYLTGGGKYEIGLLSPTPDQLDFLIGQGTGGVGRESLKAWQFGSTVATGENMPMYKVPIAGRFVGETTGQASETSKFYNNLKRIGEHKAALDEMQKARDLSAMIEYRKENPDASLVKQADKASTDISDLKRRKRELLENGASPEQIRMMEEMITTRVRSYNERLSARS